jgi:hypothetical protein
MTTDEIRDDVAGMLPEWEHKHGRWYHRRWHVRGSGQKRHPCPPTLDGAAAAAPKGWSWRREYDPGEDEVQWAGFGPRGQMVIVPDTGDEIHDRYALARACLMAERGDKE